jgi:hypothetical protein
LFRAAAELVAQQALDQQTQLVVLGVQFALLMQQCAQHLLQQGGIIGQAVRVNLHPAMMNDDTASQPDFSTATAPF